MSCLGFDDLVALYELHHVAAWNGVSFTVTFAESCDNWDAEILSAAPSDCAEVKKCPTLAEACRRVIERSGLVASNPEKSAR